MGTWGDLNSVRPATNPNAPKLPYQNTPPKFIDPPGTYRSPIPGFRPDPDPLGFPLDKRGVNQPAQAQPQTPNLNNILRYWHGGQRVLSDEMYNHMGGDSLLEEIRRVDPNAQWVETEQYNDGPMGRRLDFDVTKLPEARLPNGKTMAGNDVLGRFKPKEMYERLMVDKNAYYTDPIYGDLTDDRNVRKDKDPFWVQAAPYVIGALPGLLGAGAMSGLARMATGAIQGLGQSGGRFNPMSLAAGAAGMIPGVGAAMRVAGPAMTAYGLYNAYRRNQ